MLSDTEENMELDKMKLKRFDHIYFIDLCNYELKKQYWENFCCEIEYTIPCYIYSAKNEGGDIYILNKKKLKEAYLHLKIENEKFIKIWLKDENRKKYNKIYFEPINKVNIIQEKYSYNIFIGWNEEVLTEYEKVKYDLAIKPFIDLGKALCEDNEEYYNYFIKYIAHMIQKPNEYCPIAFIIKGNQGTGKNVFLNSILGLMHKQNRISFATTSDFKKIFEKNNTNEYKLLVNINECESREYFDKKLNDINIRKRNNKYEKPIKIYDYTRLIIFTNRNDIILMNEKTINRQYVIFNTSNKYLSNKYTTSFWKSLIDHFNKPQFKACLYDYLNNIDITNYDFVGEKPITETLLYYTNMMNEHI